MEMIRRPPLLSLSLAITVIFGLAVSGCTDDPYDPETWIDKLDDPTEVKRAVTELQRLKKEKGIGKAIVPLSKTWEKQNRPEKVLKVIIELAEEGAGGPHWDKALPVLHTALDEFDVGDDRSIQNAIAAADALGRAKSKESVQPLIRAVNKSMPKLSPGQRVRLAAMKALGQFGSEKRAVDALIKVLTADLKNQAPQLFAAAALSLADARSPDAIEPLILALFKIAPIFPQCRRALIAIGKPVVPKLISIFEGKDEALNQFAKDNKFNINCKDGGIGPETTCVAPSNLEYKAALLLGDFYAEESVKPLLKGLDQVPLPSYFEKQMPGPNQHTAILDSLRKIGDPSAAPRVLKYVTDPGTDDGTRPLAIDVYSFLANDTSALPELAKMIKDDEADEQVRMSAGLAYGRLARSEKQYEPILYMVNRYKKEADKHEGEAKKTKKAFDKAKKIYDDLQAKSIKNKKNKKLAAKAKKAKADMDKKQEASSFAESRVTGYRNYQRTFEQNLARAHVGTMCKKDPKCYMAILDKTPDDIGKDLDKWVKDWKDWSDAQKKDLKVAAVERALLEVRKLGAASRPVTDQLLKHVESTDRITRQGALLALSRVAEVPCEKCVKRMEEVIESQKDQSTLQALSVETQAMRNYFLWAGK